jgi:hydrogenase nickel incorporation protein HypA/HybF
VHELSLSSAIVETVVRHAEGRKVNAVEFSVGALRQVVPASLEFYFEIVSRDTVCEGARLELQVIEARVSCGGCGTEWTLDDPVFRCASCESTDVRVLSGSEFLVESIDVENEGSADAAASPPEEAQACTAPR